MRKMAILILACIFLLSCTSQPYVIRTTINESRNQRIERVCTHKYAFSPWFVVVAAGVFVHKYDQECHDEFSSLSEPSKYEIKAPIKGDTAEPNIL